MPDEVYSRVAENASRAFIGEVFGTAFGYWLAGVWRLGAQALFWLFAGLSALEALHLLSVAGAGTVGWALLGRVPRLRMVSGFAGRRSYGLALWLSRLRSSTFSTGVSGKLAVQKHRRSSPRRIAQGASLQLR